MKSPALRLLIFGMLLLGIACGAYLTRDRWMPHHAAVEQPPASQNAPVAISNKVVVSDQAQRNLGIVSKPLKTAEFWKTVIIQGMIVDRPGFSDREIVAPAIGTVSHLFHVPGDMVKPGDKLFSLTLASDSIQQTQAELFKTSQEIPLAKATRDRLASAGNAIPKIEVIDAENVILRLEAAAKTYRHELLNRGFTPEQIDQAAAGQLISSITLLAPARPSDAASPTPNANESRPPASDESAPFELQELQVELGEQVQAGQTLCRLSNHQSLAIEGRAFRDETSLLERSVQKQWPVEVDFQEDASSEWPRIEQPFAISYIANTIDPATRTFAFLIPLDNQFRAVDHKDRQQILWRFRPGQKVLIKIRVEELTNVFVLPAAAVVFEGADAYIFTQNVNTFERKAVQIVFRDRDRIVIANDGSLPTYGKDNERQTIAAVSRAAAAQLNRLTKAGSTDVPKGYHIHADGSLHKNEDEGK